jgi:hypothetical protein
VRVYPTHLRLNISDPDEVCFQVVIHSSTLSGAVLHFRGQSRGLVNISKAILALKTVDALCLWLMKARAAAYSYGAAGGL